MTSSLTPPPLLLSLGSAREEGKKRQKGKGSFWPLYNDGPHLQSHLRTPRNHLILPATKHRKALLRSSNSTLLSSGILLGLGLGFPSAPLVVLHPSVALGELCALVDEVAEEEEVVLGGDGKGVAHESCGVDAKGAGHGTGDPVPEKIIGLAWV